MPGYVRLRHGATSALGHRTRGRHVGEAAHPGPPTATIVMWHDAGNVSIMAQYGRRVGEADLSGSQPATTAQMQLLPLGALRDHQADTDAAGS